MHKYSKIEEYYREKVNKATLDATFKAQQKYKL